MKVIYGNAVQDARGKNNGNVYSKNRFGAYVRTKVTPVNRNTSFQSAVRAAFSNLSKNWGASLTDLQRKAWIDYAAVTPFHNIFAESRFLTGSNTYIKTNAALANIGVAAIATPPNSNITGTVGAITLSAAIAAGGSLSLATVEGGIPVGAKISVYATPQLSPGINYVKSQLRYIGSFTIGATPYDLKPNWVAKFGSFPTVAGKKIFVAVQIITTEGVLSVAVATATIVV